VDDIDLALARLAHTVATIRAGETEGLGDRVAERGEAFVRGLHGLLRLTRTHSINNAAFTRPLMELRKLLADLVDALGAVQLVAVEDLVYVNDVRVRLGERSDVGRDLGRDLLRHGVGGLTVHEVLNAVQLRLLVECLAAAPAPDDPFKALGVKLAARGLGSVELWAPFRFKLSDEVGVAFRRKGAGTRRAATLLDRAVEDLGASRVVNAIPIRRMVVEMIGTGRGGGLTDELTAITPYAAHVLRVTQVALLLGAALGLDPEAMQDLGVAAMLHDVGYAAREGAEPGDDQHGSIEGYAPPYERHAAAGARLLLRNRGFHPGKVRRILATIEHHRDYDDPAGCPSLFGRILRIAEDYDTLIRARGGGKSPAEALELVATGAGTRYDPVLTQLLVNTLGAYPPGTLLELVDGRVVRTTSTVRSPGTFARPLAEIVRLGSRGAGAAEVVDLADAGRVARTLQAR
jgi:hypothetical protein